MIVPLLIATVGHFSTSLAALADKFLLTKAFNSPATYVFWVGLGFLSTFLLLPFGFVLPSSTAIFAIEFIGGLTFGSGIYFLYKTIQLADVSTAVPVVGALIPIVTAVGAYFFLDERLLLIQLFGILILLLGFLLLISDKLAIPKRAIFSAVTSSFLFASSTVIMKYVYTREPFISALAFSRLGMFFLSVILFSLPHVRKEIFSASESFDFKKLAILIIGQATGAIGFVLLNVAINLSSPTIVNAMEGLRYAFLFLFSLLLHPYLPDVFKETVSKGIFEKFGGLVLLIIGIILVSQGFS